MTLNYKVSHNGLQFLSCRFLTFSYILAFNACLLLAPITMCYDWQVGSIPLLHSLWDRRNLETLVLLVVLLSLGLHCLVARKVLSLLLYYRREPVICKQISGVHSAKCSLVQSSPSLTPFRDSGGN